MLPNNYSTQKYKICKIPKTRTEIHINNSNQMHKAWASKNRKSTGKLQITPQFPTQQANIGEKTCCNTRETRARDGYNFIIGYNFVDINYCTY